MTRWRPRKKRRFSVGTMLARQVLVSRLLTREKNRAEAFDTFRVSVQRQLATKKENDIQDANLRRLLCFASESEAPISFGNIWTRLWMYLTIG